MNVNDRSAVSRQFVASAPPISSRMNDLATGTRKGIFYLAYTVVAAAVFALTMVRSLRPWMQWGLGAVIAVIVLAPLIWLVYVWWRSRRGVLIDVTSDALIVNRIVFSLVDAKLGPWAAMGVALHLESGSHRFVLGGRDRRIAPSTRLDGPPVSTVDAWLWSSEFDELATLGGSLSGADARGPAPTEPTRCLLFPNPYLAEQLGSFAFRKHLRLQQSLSRPSLIVDLDDDAIRWIEPDSDALPASAWRAQVTATPAVFQPDSVTSGDGSTYNYPAITGLVVSLSGAQPLTIGCLDLVGSRFRFTWRGNVASRNERTTHVVSGGDLLALAEKFGLTAQLEDGAIR
ncbi:hypothetical protein [Mycobacterium asiaticum]|uniref:Uncharacterized protein n=1 Tax=Mycobacterium asiaticum TaxID=1790 RepID=A0A1A3BL95_MYCAS|nr:hypothetical protein [Mycobacterium asiaticum]OBI75764.1 hypothetical protein A9X01_04415 [Mycobacterium asiaticum]